MIETLALSCNRELPTTSPSENGIVRISVKLPPFIPLASLPGFMHNVLPDFASLDWESPSIGNDSVFTNGARSEGTIRISGWQEKCKAPRETDKSKGMPEAAG